jgi:PAS domain S-box-containing protein
MHSSGEDLPDLEALLSAAEPASVLDAILASTPSEEIIARAPDGKILRVSEFAARLVRRPQSDFLGYTLAENFGPVRVFDSSGRRLAATERPLGRALRGEFVTGFEIAVEAPDGEKIPLLSSAAPIHNARGELIGAITAVADLRSSKALEQKARDYEQQFREMADTLPQLAWIADAQGEIYWYNQRWYDYTGMSLEEPKGWGWRAAHHPDHVDRVVERIQRAWETGEPWEDTFPLRDATGGYRWFLSRARPTKDHQGRVIRWFGTNTDVTEQLAAQELLHTLLKEVSHRVNNSLVLVATLLNMQARRLEGDAHVALNQAASRVHAMAAVHGQLWRSAESREINLEKYLSTLCKSVAASAPMHDTVCQVEAAMLDPDRAVPLGVFTNEILTNAYKYAYPPGEEGEIRLIGTRESEERYRIEIADAGCGLPADYDLAQDGSGLGTWIITRLAKQLGGDLTARSTHPGASFTLVFPLFSPTA